MQTVVAIDTSVDPLLLVAAQRGHDETIEILEVGTLPLADLLIGGDKADDKTEDSQTTSQQSLTSQNNGRNSLAVDIEELLGLPVDTSVAVVSGESVLYRKISLPFNQPKKIEQAAPFQVQDGLPFDLDEFILHNLVLGKSGVGEYEILSSIIPESEVAGTLSALNAFGADPKVLTSRAGALAAIAERYQSDEAAFGVLEIGLKHASLAIIHDGKILLLREFTSSSDNSTSVEKTLLSALNCSIARAEREHDCKLSKIIAIGTPELLRQVAKQLSTPVKPMQYEGFIRNKTSRDLRLSEISWSLGLLSRELLTPTTEKRLVDFRQGAFSYKPAWRDFWTAVQSELMWFVVVIGSGIIWAILSVYGAHAKVNKVEDGIKSLLKIAAPGELIAKGGEVSFLEERVSNLEEQLRGMGSLSSLSPLDSLKELSTTITGDIDIQIDKLEVGQSRISFRGSVPNTPSVGRLSGMLEKEDKKFCAVNVEPISKDARSTRVKFNAEISLCE